MTTTTVNRTILALHLGQYKSVACAYEPDRCEARFHHLRRRWPDRGSAA
jgi:hypothetical protein